MDQQKLKRYYRPDEVAKLFSVTTRSVYEWVRAGKIRHVHTPGGAIRIPEDAVANGTNFTKT